MTSENESKGRRYPPHDYHRGDLVSVDGIVGIYLGSVTGTWGRSVYLRCAGRVLEVPRVLSIRVLDPSQLDLFQETHEPFPGPLRPAPFDPHQEPAP